MTSPVIEAMARSLAKAYGNFNYDDFGEDSANKYRRMAECSLRAIEENITDEMVMAGMNADGPMEPYDAYRAIFTAMLRAARGGRCG